MKTRLRQDLYRPERERGFDTKDIAKRTRTRFLIVSSRCLALMEVLPNEGVDETKSVARPKRQRGRSSDSFSDSEPCGEPPASSLPACTAEKRASKNTDAVLSDPDIYRVLKRAPLRTASSRSDVYVTRGSNFLVLVSRAIMLLRSQKVVHLHALGAALERCADVALAIQARLGDDAVVLSPTTDTVVVYDDYEPLVPGYPARTRKRSKNALHITVSLTDGFG